jgi:hypothetical protein
MQFKTWAMVAVGGWLLSSALAHGADGEEVPPGMEMASPGMVYYPAPASCVPHCYRHFLRNRLACHPLSQLGQSKACCETRACCHKVGQWFTYCSVERGCGLCCRQPDPCSAPPPYLFFLENACCGGGPPYAVAPYDIDGTCLKPKCKEVAANCCHHLTDKCHQATAHLLHRCNGPVCYPEMPMNGEYWGNGLPEPPADQ